MVGLLVAAALAAACGGAEEDARAPARATTGPTDAELAFREQIVEKIKSGDYKCYCTGELRARERAAKGDPRG
jgi:hypothetical protein